MIASVASTPWACFLNAQNIMKYNKILHRRVINRILLCCITICYLWMTSLQVSFTIVENFGLVSPTLEALKEQCVVDGYNMVEVQKKDFQKCASIESQQCQTIGESSLKAETLRVQKAQQYNQAMLLKEKQQKSNCTSLLENLKYSLGIWVSFSEENHLNVMQSAAPSFCREKVNSILQIPKSSTKSIQNSAISFSESSDSTVSHLAAYSSTLVDYNQEYLRNKTQGLHSLMLLIAQVNVGELPNINMSFTGIQQNMDDMLACIALDPSISSPSGKCHLSKSLEDLYRDLQTQMNTQIRLMQSTMEDFSAEYNEFKNALSEALANADDFYDSIAGASGLLAWIITNMDVFNAANQFCGKGTPDWCSLNKGDWSLQGLGIPKAPQLTLYDMPSADAMWRQVKPAIDEAREQLQLHSLTVIESFSGTLQGVSSVLQGVADFSTDYSPPAYPYTANASLDERKHLEASEAFRQSIASKQRINATAPLNATTTIETAQTTLARLVQSAFAQSWSSFSPGWTRAAEFWASLWTLQGILFLFDYLYRGLQTGRIVVQFWRRSIGALPKADVRVTEDQGGTQGVAAVALKLLPFIWIQVAFIVAFIVVLAYVWVGLYMDAYSSYSAACVQGSANSTFLSRNLYSAAYNYASMDANQEISATMSSYNLKYSMACLEAQQGSQKISDAQWEEHVSLNASVQATIADINFFEECIDLSLIQEMYISNCIQNTSSACPIEDPTKYHPPAALLSGGSCPLGAELPRLLSSSDSANANADAGVFLCDKIPPCTIACSGPDASLLQQTTQKCACTTEWYLHSRVAQAILVVAVYVALNISRSAIVMGALILFWNELNLPVFEVAVSCTRSGEVVLLAEKSSDEAPHSARNDLEGHGKRHIDGRIEFEPHSIQGQRKSIERSLDQAMGRFIAKGWLLLAAGVILIVPCFVVLPYVKDNIAYRQHPQYSFNAK